MEFWALKKKHYRPLISQKYSNLLFYQYTVKIKEEFFCFRKIRAPGNSICTGFVKQGKKVFVMRQSNIRRFHRGKLNNSFKYAITHLKRFSGAPV